jgi:hypothetical protein
LTEVNIFSNLIYKNPYKKWLRAHGDKNLHNAELTKLINVMVFETAVKGRLNTTNKIKRIQFGSAETRQVFSSKQLQYPSRIFNQV